MNATYYKHTRDMLNEERNNIIRQNPAACKMIIELEKVVRSLDTLRRMS